MFRVQTNSFVSLIQTIRSRCLGESLIFEGAVGEAVGRGRRPTFLYIDSRQRCVVGVDIRVSRTYILVTDLMGRQLGVVSSFQTNRDVNVLIHEFTHRIKQLDRQCRS